MRIKIPNVLLIMLPGLSYILVSRNPLPLIYLQVSMEWGLGCKHNLLKKWKSAVLYYCCLKNPRILKGFLSAVQLSFGNNLQIYFFGSLGSVQLTVWTMKSVLGIWEFNILKICQYNGKYSNGECVIECVFLKCVYVCVCDIYI